MFTGCLLIGLLIKIDTDNRFVLDCFYFITVGYRTLLEKRTESWFLEFRFIFAWLRLNGPVFWFCLRKTGSLFICLGSDSSDDITLGNIILRTVFGCYISPLVCLSEFLILAIQVLTNT